MVCYYYVFHRIVFLDGLLALILTGTMSEEGLDTGSAVECNAAVNDEEKLRRRPQTAGEHRKGRGANRGRGYNKNQHDRQLASASSRRHPNASGFRGSYHPMRGDSRLTPTKGHEDRAQHKAKNNHSEKDNELINWINKEIDEEKVQVLEQGTCYHGETASMAKPEPRQIDHNEKEILTDNQTTTEYSATFTDTRQKTRASKDLDFNHGVSKGEKTDKFSEKKLKGPNTRRNYSQGTRRLHGQSERATGDNNKRDHMYAYYEDEENHSDLAMQGRVNIYKHVAPNKMDFPSSARQPFYREHYYEPNKSHNTESRQRGLRAAGVKTKKQAYGRDYKGQKEDVLRILSHLNPVQSSQASVLIEQLRNETYECMVCCERVRCSAAVWNCHSCHHLFHLGCVRKWAKSPAALEGMQYSYRVHIFLCTNFRKHSENCGKCLGIAK